MKRFVQAIAVLMVACMGQAGPSRAESPTLCVKDYWVQNPGGPALGIAANDADTLVHGIAAKIGLGSRTGITILECQFVSKASSWYAPADIPGVREGDYIIYNPAWVREVIGNDRMWAIALFGHELGHLVQRHFTTKKNLSTLEKEKEADHFAGCAVARMNGDWPSLKNLLTRLRAEKDDLYPDRLASLETAEAGFKECDGTVPPKPPEPTVQGAPPHGCSEVMFTDASTYPPKVTKSVVCQ